MNGDKKIINSERFVVLMWEIMEARGTRKRVLKDFWPTFAKKYEELFGRSISPNGLRKKYFRWRLKIKNDSTPDTFTPFFKPRRAWMIRFCDWLSDFTGLVIRVLAVITDWFTGIDSEVYSDIVCHLSVPGAAEELMGEGEETNDE